MVKRKKKAVKAAGRKMERRTWTKEDQRELRAQETTSSPALSAISITAAMVRMFLRGRSDMTTPVKAKGGRR